MVAEKNYFHAMWSKIANLTVIIPVEIDLIGHLLSSPESSLALCHPENVYHLGER